MKTRNLLNMTLMLGVMTFATQTRAQITPEQVSARIRSHIHSSETPSTSAQQSGEGETESGFGPLYVAPVTFG
jgi:hypothetical protein